jgi:hypothetical protein
MYKKNDPLVNSVKAIMEQNEQRRRVETKLCEELGIYSRKELPREHLANYDALLEQRIQEATNSSDYSPKQKKLAAIAGNPTKIDAKDLEGARKGHASHIEEEEEQDSSNPLPPAGAKERIQNKLGTGAKSSVDPSYKHQGPSASDREEMNKKMEKLDEAKRKLVGKAKAKKGTNVKVYSSDPNDEGSVTTVRQGKRVIATGDYDRFANAYFTGNKKTNSVDDTGKSVAKTYASKIKEDVQLDEKAPKGAKYERMVKHIKDKYKKDGLTDDEKSIAYATAHKAKKKMDENLTFDDVMEEIARNLGENTFNELIKNKD